MSETNREQNLLPKELEEKTVSDFISKAESYSRNLMTFPHEDDLKKLQDALAGFEAKLETYNGGNRSRLEEAVNTAKKYFAALPGRIKERDRMHKRDMKLAKLLPQSGDPEGETPEQKMARLEEASRIIQEYEENPQE